MMRFLYTKIKIFMKLDSQYEVHCTRIRYRKVRMPGQISLK